MYEHILIATDGSDLAARAVVTGISLAKACNARATIITVTSPFNSMGDREHMFSTLPEEVREQAIGYLFEEAEATLKNAGNVAKAAGVEYALRSEENAHPFEAIIAVAQNHDCDLIVMASHGRSGASQLLLGSETAKVLTHTKLPVLVCR